jgi:hypothetical protein
MSRFAAVIPFLLAAAAAHAFEVKHRLSPTPAGLDGADFELWIPDALPAERPVRGVIGSSHYHAGASVYETAEWRAIAAQHDFAILRYKVTSNGKPIDTSPAGAKAVFQALAELAPLARRPELAHAGLIPTGLSWAAMQVCAFTSYAPERIIAAVPFRATARDIRLATSSAASARVPLLHLSAGRETFDKYKPHQSQEGFEGITATALAAMLVQPGEEHHVLGDLTFLKAWLEEVIPLRVPARIPVGKPYALLPVTQSGWLASFGIRKMDGDPWKGGDGMTEVRIGAAPKGGKAPPMKSWLPSERLAKAWQAYAETGKTGPIPPLVQKGMPGKP